MKPLAPLAKPDTTYEIAIIFMGESAKERAESFYPEIPFTIYLPDRTSPTHYFWPLQGSEVYLVDTSDSSINFIRHCATHLYSYDAILIRYISSKRTIEIKRN